MYSPTQLKLIELLGSKELSFGCIVKPFGLKWNLTVIDEGYSGKPVMCWDGEGFVHFNRNEFEIIGHEPTIADFHRWMTKNRAEQSHWHQEDDLIIFYGKTEETAKVKIMYDSSKSLLDQSASSQEKIIEFINNNNDKCEIL